MDIPDKERWEKPLKNETFGAYAYRADSLLKTTIVEPDRRLNMVQFAWCAARGTARISFEEWEEFEALMRKKIGE